ncbi:MAG: glycosyltransferase family 4 protein [Erysipelotrichaceae bacterium]|nr:glycosyltransferase family 4 protein [Erysipelotrichaceae bacterium]
MEKIKINMLSSADKIDGQGVGSAYLEQVRLIKEGAAELFTVTLNGSKKCDILHLHTVEPRNYVKMKMSHAASVCYVHFLPDTLDGSIDLPMPIFKLFKKYVISLYRYADYLIVVNPIFIHALENHGIPRKKLVYIPNYVSKEAFYQKPRCEVRALRNAYDIDENAFVVIGVGQVQTRKGVLDFVETARCLPDITFIWCGGFSFGRITDGYEKLKKIMENPPQNVKFLGIVPRAEMNELYNIADVLFMPSYNELFPMAILEAVNLHLPLVLRDLDLYEDILFHKYLSGKKNETFVSQIRSLKENAEVYAQSIRWSEEISEFYSKENVLNMWITFYKRVYREHKQKLEIKNSRSIKKE